MSATMTALQAPKQAAFETLTWLPATEHMPDDDITVLLAMDPARAGEPVWLGWCDAGTWHDATTGRTLPSGVVTHWADMPAGPGAA